MGASTRLDSCNLPGRVNVRDVENSHTAESLIAHLLLNAFRSAVQTASCFLNRHEQKVLINRYIALTTGADDGDTESRIL